MAEVSSDPNGRGQSVADIAARLNERMHDLAHYLLGAPNPTLTTSQQLRYGNKGSLAVDIDGDKTGKWFDHERGIGGDGLELICQKLNLRNGAACDWARDWLGLSLHRTAPVNPVVLIQDQRDHPPPKSQEETNPKLTPQQRAEKIAKIITDCCDTIEGTPAEFYLKRRGITIPAPDCIGFRPHAYGGFGALVALATDADGKVLALQQIYLTAVGEKADIPVVKRTNKILDGWSKKAAVRLPGKQPLILAEGVETALSIWQATGQETWACLGISNIGNAPIPDKLDVIVARDGDLPGSKADGQIKRAIENLETRGLTVSVATPPEGQDFNDILRLDGEDAVRVLITAACSVTNKIKSPSTHLLFIGSDVEIAKRVREDLIERYGKIIHAEGAFWRYGKSHWETISEHELRLAAHQYDGAPYFTPNGEPSLVKLGKGRIDSLLNELTMLVTDELFFAQTQIGINCASGFIRFAADGTPIIEPHNSEYRCRHTLPSKWDGARILPANTLLFKLLNGVFLGDADADDKVKLLAEILGSAALGYATKLLQPRAAILNGGCAENGKSQILDLGRGLIPPSAACSLSAARMGDERHVIGLVGKLLNACDELSSAAAIASDTFKAIITGEPVEGRDVYKSRVEFRPIAQNLFATNNLPPFQGGMDRGVQRRLIVIPFNRVIPLEERVEGIGQRITTEEADHLLAFAVEGASRLIRQRNFTIPASSKAALTDWILGADSVLAWLHECVDVKPCINGFPNMATRTAYEKFHMWAAAEGFNRDKLPAINGFVQRVQANASGIESKRTSSGRIFLGLTLKHETSPSFTSYYDGGNDA